MGLAAWIIGVCMAVLGLAGLFLASGAHGNQTFYTMGLALFVVACVIIMGLLRQDHGDRT